MHRRVLVEQRCDVHRSDQAHECGKDDRQSRAPHPPILPETPHQPKQRHHQDGSQHNADSERHHLFAHPGAEALIQKAILVLAEVALVHGEGESEQRHDDDELNPVEHRLQRMKAGEALGQLAHPRRPTEPQQQPHHDYSRQEIPQLQPIAALEIGIGAGPLCWRHLSQIGVNGCVHIEGGSDRGSVCRNRSGESTGEACLSGCDIGEHQNSQKNKSACSSHHGLPRLPYRRFQPSPVPSA